MKCLKAVALLAVLSVVLFNVGCEKPKTDPVPQEPEAAAPRPFPRDNIPENNMTAPPPAVEPAPAAEHPITTVQPSDEAPQHKASKSTKAKPKEKYASAKKSDGKTYVVKKGDTLQEISQKFYGTTKRWKKIANANKDVIKDPNKLVVGTKIKIP